MMKRRHLDINHWESGLSGPLKEGRGLMVVIGNSRAV